MQGRFRQEGRRGDDGGMRGGRGGHRRPDSRRGGDRGGDRGGSRGRERGEKSGERGGLFKRAPQKNSHDRGARRGGDRGDRGGRGGGNQGYQNGQDKPAYQKKKFNPEGNNKQNLTTLSQSILSKSIGEQDKEKFIERSLLIIDEYGIDNVIVKGAGSRLVQACLKYGNNASKELVFLKIMKSNIDKVLTDNFGKYIVKKIMVHVKDKKLLYIFHNYMQDNLDSLMTNPNGRIAVSDYLESLPEHRNLEILQEKMGAQVTEEAARERATTILENKTFNNTIDQFWLKHHWK